jgi:hypothetical protein
MYVIAGKVVESVQNNSAELIQKGLVPNGSTGFSRTTVIFNFNFKTVIFNFVQGSLEATKFAQKTDVSGTSVLCKFAKD